jgi:hypothetical protein
MSASDTPVDSTPLNTLWGAAAFGAHTRVDGHAKVMDTARFASDVALPDLAHAAVVTSPIGRGRIICFELAGVVQAPGAGRRRRVLYSGCRRCRLDGREDASARRPVSNQVGVREPHIRATCKVLPHGAQLQVTHLMLAGEWAVVELESRAVARDGYRFANRYCWLTRFSADGIVEVRAYLDSTMVQTLLDHHAV